MSTRTREQIKKDYDEVQDKIILLSTDLKNLRNELEELMKDVESDFIGRLDKKIILFNKLEKFNEQLDELGLKKLILIEEYNLYQQ